MAKVETIDIVKLELTSKEFKLIKQALDIAEGQFYTVADDSEARALLRDLNG